MTATSALVAATRPVSEGCIRIAPVIPIPDLLSERGIDPAAVFATVGLGLDALADPDNPVPFTAVGRLIDRCTELTGCRHFGLLLGERGGPGTLGLVGLLMQHSADVEAALRNAILYLHLHDRGAVVTLRARDGVASVGYALYGPPVGSSDQIADAALAITCNVLRALCGADWAASEVLLAHRRPADSRPYQRFFRAPVRFDAAENAVRFPAKWLRHPLPDTSPDLRAMVHGQLAWLDARYGTDFPAKVRRMVRTLLVSGECSADHVAGLFAMQRRTLSRRLQAEGATFEGILDEIRSQAAREFLRHTEMSIAQISSVVGYADVSAFTRAFRRWTGATPAQWRSSQGTTSDRADG